MTWLTDALACYRLTRLATRDLITEPLRREAKAVPFLGALLECAWCCSAWSAFGVVVFRRLAPKAWEPVAQALAFSAVTGLIAENLD